MNRLGPGFTDGCCLLPLSYHSEGQSAAAVLILVNTDGFDGHHKERFGRALPRSKPGRVLRRVSELGRQQSYPLA